MHMTLKCMQIHVILRAILFSTRAVQFRGDLRIFRAHTLVHVEGQDDAAASLDNQGDEDKDPSEARPVPIFLRQHPARENGWDDHPLGCF